METPIASIVSFAAATDFPRDELIVKNYAGAQLTREQFAAYSPKFLLRNEFGNPRAVFAKYSSDPEISLEVSSAHILRDILNALHEAGVTLDLGPEDGPFRKKMENAIYYAAVQNHEWLNLPDAYTAYPKMAEKIEQLISSVPGLKEQIEAARASRQRDGSPSADLGQTSRTLDA